MSCVCHCLVDLFITSVITPDSTLNLLELSFMAQYFSMYWVWINMLEDSVAWLELGFETAILFFWYFLPGIYSISIQLFLFISDLPNTHLVYLLVLVFSLPTAQIALSEQQNESEFDKYIQPTYTVHLNSTDIDDCVVNSILHFESLNSLSKHFSIHQITSVFCVSMHWKGIMFGRQDV